MATARRPVEADERKQWRRIQEAFRMNAPHLIRQGTIVSKKVGSRRKWVLRFVVHLPGRTVQRSLHVCCEDQLVLLNRARKLLRRYRERAGWAKELALFARLAGAARVALSCR